jgi:hypothetical protein
MRRAVSVSLGSSRRDTRIELQLLGQKVQLERIGTDGDLERAARLFEELDGTVDALGLGGASLSLSVRGRSYPLRSVLPIVRHVRRTPLVDGAGLRNTLECRAARLVDEVLGVSGRPKRVLCAMVCDRWGLYTGFRDRGYECLIGDLIFGLKLPIAIHRERTLGILMTALAPVVTRLPFSMLYPFNDSPSDTSERFARYFNWATIVAGDCYYLSKYMPLDMHGTAVVTNTTTPEDVVNFRERGVRHLFTTTPVIDGRSFGTNLLEAGLVAASGLGRCLSDKELVVALDELGIEPKHRVLNGD